MTKKRTSLLEANSLRSSWFLTCTQQEPSPGSICSGFGEVFFWLNYEHQSLKMVRLAFWVFFLNYHYLFHLLMQRNAHLNSWFSAVKDSVGLETLS